MGFNSAFKGLNVSDDHEKNIGFKATTGGVFRACTTVVSIVFA